MPKSPRTELRSPLSPTHAQAPRLAAAPSRLAVASHDVQDPNYWSLKGDFLQTGVHAFSKSGKHPIEDPLNPTNKAPHWLQIQFNVIVPDESRWHCELTMKDLGSLPCGKQIIVGVQSGGKQIEDVPASLFVNSFIRKKFVIDLKPADPEDDPRCAISYFIEYDEKKYQQALNGTLPYQFLLQRVSDGAGKKRHWWSSK